MTAPPRPSRSGTRPLAAWLLAGLLAIYAAAIWWNLPAPAGTRYVLPPRGTGSPAPHWWDKTQGLRGWSVYPEGWEWAYIPAAPLLRWLPLLALGAVGVAALWWWARRPPRGHWAVAGALVSLVVLGYGLQLGALWLKHPNANQLLYDRVVNAGFTGYFTSATQITDPGVFFGGYADALARTDAARLCGHCRTHPPGPILFYWLPLRLIQSWGSAGSGFRDALVSLTNITPAAAAPAETILALLAGHAVLLGGALIVVPLYGLARRLAGRARALPLAALGLLLPGLLLMSPELDQVYGTQAAVLLYLALRGLQAPRHRAWWGLATGLWFALCLYATFGLWLLAVPLGAMGVAAILAPGLLAAPAVPLLEGPGVPVGATPSPAPLGRASRTREVVRWGAALAAGTAVPWLLLWGVAHLDVPRVLQITSSVHLQGITTRRPYGPWLLFNLVDFLQFLGLPIVVACLAVLRRRNLFAWLFWGVLLALDISGTARAEVGRLWIFLMPLALLALYYAAGRGRLSNRHVAALLAAQFAICLLIGGRWLTP